MANHFDVLINSFIENAVGIDNHFLSSELSEGLRQNIVQLHSENKMRPAGIGNSKIKDPHQQERSDSIYWMDSSHDNVHEQNFLQSMEQFIAYLNATCYTGITSYEFHYALYAEGSFYKRHKDQFDNNSSRKYSLISYLNTQWEEKDGGQLLLYNKGKVQQVLPQSETTVFFKSNEMEHEVSVAHRSRMSIAGWLKSD